MRLAVLAGAAPGHIFPAASLATALTSRGHDVLVITGGEWLPALHRQGLAGAALPAGEPSEKDRDFGHWLSIRSARLAPGVADVLAAHRAEAAIVDTLTVEGAFAAELAGVPWIELIPHPLQDVSSFLPTPGSGFALPRTPLGRGRDRLFRALHSRAVAKGVAQRQTARRQLGLSVPGGPMARLVATLPALELPRPDWPPRTVVVGPMEWDPAEGELPLPPGDAPLVFVTASTAPTGATGVLDAALCACEVLGLRLACTQFRPYEGDLPRWASVGMGRQDPLLAEAHRSGGVVVAGGGHGMVAKALVRGLPLVCIPGGGEQYDNSQRIRRLGAGLSILPFRLTAARLVTALARLLGDPGYGEAARRAAASTSRLGPGYAAVTVERLLDRRPALES